MSKGEAADQYAEIVLTRCVKKKLWRALFFKDATAKHLAVCYYGSMTERQCVSAIRKALRDADRLLYTLAQTRAFHQPSLLLQTESAYSQLLAGFSRDQVQEQVVCNLKSSEP